MRLRVLKGSTSLWYLYGIALFLVFIFVFEGVFNIPKTAPILSFVIQQYFIQFIVLGVFLTLLYINNKNSADISDLKNTIEEHNQLIREDIDVLKGEK
ncbi:MAG: hypothetical protein A2Y03_06635 [Omnitrophica WOR_2 bacterium GWF2_38_59]|nr:MAG: hypothetical protein A2Y03_06635 [Omnitrophica WOR_2 bacterium GWF2_38_59]OGX50473.1 MAG: hypothetical protein A2243_01940 [Omnitrophica WOR_2 bacterium RIFOXYA2_FULL_38_17]OGX51564.1 MAG: hypothetical protein A2267_08830 [Omnitrophica WOR_2 bacterium RIFOXYA12_FULL_38_10]OGX59482.1 MAG: hypothetical protein A2306_09565 [Omnitrophica WOR_2 bacterium RIFOXYB2_FULL_38_16]HBG62052.1 hypothetical protein [Candidatus Omnitrophota bacterium]